jgi:hypothetical protein
VSQEELLIFWEVIVLVILSKEVYMYMSPIPNGFRDKAISLLLLLLLLWLYSSLLGLGCFSVSWSYTQSVGLLQRGISPSQGRYLHTEQHKHRINAHNTDVPALSGNRAHDPSVRAGEDSSCLRPRGHCVRRCFTVQLTHCWYERDLMYCLWCGETESTWYVCHYLTYCTSPGW